MVYLSFVAAIYTDFYTRQAIFMQPSGQLITLIPQENRPSHSGVHQSVSTMLSITNGLQPFLAKVDHGINGGSVTIDPVAQEEARKAFTMACKRLGALAGDHELWGKVPMADPVAKAQARLLEAQREQTAIATDGVMSQVVAMEQQIRPSHIHKPVLQTNDDGSFSAVLMIANGVVEGRGDSPESALVDFDYKFMGGVKPTDSAPDSPVEKLGSKLPVWLSRLVATSPTKRDGR